MSADDRVEVAGPSVGGRTGEGRSRRQLARRATSLLLATWAFALVSTSGALGGGRVEPTAAQLLAGAKRAVQAATSVRLVGTVTNSGSPIGLDLDLVASRGGAGTIHESGYVIRIVRVGNKAYFDAGVAFWMHFAGSLGAQIFAGRWIEASATSGQLASFTPLTSMRTLLSQLLGSTGSTSEGPETKVDGQRAIPLRAPNGGGSLYVAASGQPFPLEATSKDGGALRFESWNKPLSVAAPAHAIDLTSLRKPQPQEVAGEGASVVLPSGWTRSAIPAGAGEAFKLLALGPEENGFRANLNVIVEALPAGDGLRQAIFSGASAAYEYVGTVRQVTVGGVSGLEYTSTKAVKAGNRAVLTDLWAFVHHGRVYQFTYTALASQAGRYGPLFAVSASTIRFTAAYAA